MLRSGKLASIVVIGVLSVAVSCVLIHEYDTAQAGYAVYPVLSMWILCASVAVLGLALLFPRRTRWLGTVTVAGGLALPCIFFIGIHISQSAGWVSWANQQMQMFGPEVRAGEVVYYNLGVADAEIESFQQESLYQARADGRGFDFKPGITYFLRLTPSQAHGHDGFAIGLSQSLPQKSREQLRSSLGESPLVFRVYHDTAPKDIPVP